MAARLRKGDTVVVISGAHKGRRGEIAQVMPKKEKAIVAGVNLATHHVKPGRMGEEGGIQRREAAIHMSNVALYCERCAKGVRVKVEGRGKDRTRSCTTCGSQISKG